MTSILTLITFTATFLIVTIAANKISYKFQTYGMPLISSLLLVGIVCGPHVLGLINPETVSNLLFINDISLAFIAFAASSELYLKDLRSRIKSIKWLTIGQLVITFSLITAALVSASNQIPFFTESTVSAKIAIAFLTASVLCARSPASVIAVISELRAKGPFTSTVLGTTVLVDFSVIIVFAVSLSATGTLVNGEDFTFGFILILLGEIFMSFIIGVLVGSILNTILKSSLKKNLKAYFLLLVGFGTYELFYIVKEYSIQFINYEIYLEPLLICLIGSFYVVNYTSQRQEFLKIIHDTSPYIYSVFFTYAGALLAINLIPAIWPAALIILVINALSLFIGTYLGGVIATEKTKFNTKYWTSFMTQAGVGLGLATIVSNSFSWGPQFSAVVISVIVINQLIGPMLFKRSILTLGESRQRAEMPDFDGIRDAIIVGFENQSLALARQLKEHGWETKIATQKNINTNDYPDLTIVRVQDFSLESLNSLEAHHSEAFVLMLTDEENLVLCELIYQHIGTKDVIVRLNHSDNFDSFHQLGAQVVNPATAIVSLLDHFVRSPQATSLLLGMQHNQDTIDLEVLNPNLFGIYVRDLRLPADIIILSLQRNNQMVISHGYTRLRKGDIITLVGSKTSLQKLTILFDADNP